MAGKFEMHFHGSVGEHIDTVKEMTVNIGSDGTVTKDKGDKKRAARLLGYNINEFLSKLVRYHIQ